MRAFASKNKANKAAYKRFLKLEDGTYLHKQAGRNHNFAKKSSAYRSHHKRPAVTSSIPTRKLDKLYAN